MSLPEPRSDVVRGARKGDPACFEKIVSLYEGLVFNFAYRMTWNREDAREMCQEVFFRLFRNSHKYQHEKKFGPWFMKLAVNACINESKKRRRARETAPQAGEGEEPLAQPSPVPGAEALLQSREREAQVRKAIENLGEPYRAVVVLRYLKSLSYQEIAALLDLPDGTVKTRLFRAREALRESLERVGIKE
jgi:RNA polymerase sigma-70 factor (ECF subfamily)